MSDRLGDFLELYGEYLAGRIAFEDVSWLGSRPQKRFCPRCDRTWTKGRTYSRVDVALGELCSDCETWARERRRPLPVARVVNAKRKP